jgi:hypothetical protein
MVWGISAKDLRGGPDTGKRRGGYAGGMLVHRPVCRSLLVSTALLARAVASRRTPPRRRSELKGIQHLERGLPSLEASVRPEWALTRPTGSTSWRRRATLGPHLGSGGYRRPPMHLPHPAAAQQTWLRQPGPLRGAITPNPGSGRPTASLRRRWTTPIHYIDRR